MEENIQRCLPGVSQPNIGAWDSLDQDVGITPAEMADLYGVTPVVLRQRLSRARAMLVHQLKTMFSENRRSPAREVAI